jgi:tetratricopeptide (TPR) repeat protein
MRRPWFPFLTFVLVSACAGASPKPVVPAAHSLPTPSVVTDTTYPEVMRAFQRLGVRDPAREPLRQRLAAYWIQKGNDAALADRYTQVVSTLTQISDLYTPTEWQDAKIPPELEGIAKYLVAKGGPRGDEARVMSGLLVLRLLHADDGAIAEYYDRLMHWGFDARADMSGPLERFEGLVEAWEEHARLTPTPEVLATLVQLYRERRDALVRLFQSSEEQVPLSASIFQGVQRTALNVAGVFLRYGDTASALSQVRELGASSGVEERLIEILEATADDGNTGAGALLDLSRAYLEAGRADVARALCVSGLRSRGDDARFPQCLARIAATENDYVGALAWYADAIAIVPEERALYDEILEVLNGLIEQGNFSANAVGTHILSIRATEILSERMRRWPDAPPPVTPQELYAAIGALEMNAGNAKDAEHYFKDSLQAQPSAATYLQLGILLERTGRAREAAEQYRHALGLVKENGPDADRQRAELYERLGDAERSSGQKAESLQSYEKSLALWDALVPLARSRRAGGAELRRGVLLGRLGRLDEAKIAFERAMDAAPSARETYATILAFLVVGAPDAAFAQKVFHIAQNQVGLEPEWKVYFALWLRMIAGRSGLPVEGDVLAVFDSFSDGDDWFAKLAKFGSGKLNYDTLLEEAEANGEKAEAYFYEGGRRLSQGDDPGARAMFAKVLATQMVNFYEFSMAQELLASPAPIGGASAAPLSPAVQVPQAAPAPPPPSSASSKPR